MKTQYWADINKHIEVCQCNHLSDSLIEITRHILTVSKMLASEKKTNFEETLLLQVAVCKSAARGEEI